MSESRKPRPSRDSDLIARVRAAARQEQFLEVVSAEEARVRFERHLDLAPLPAEGVALADARTRVLARHTWDAAFARQLRHYARLLDQPSLLSEAPVALPA
jgi:hypothetical protein